MTKSENLHPNIQQPAARTAVADKEDLLAPTKKASVSRSMVAPRPPNPAAEAAEFGSSVVCRAEVEDASEEYSEDILQKLLEHEKRAAGVTPMVPAWLRSRLVDWLVEVYEKFGLRHETFFLTVSIVDRYLSKVPVGTPKLQLVGVTALFIAAKFEEMRMETKPPSVDELIYITAMSYSSSEILKMECAILQALQFEIACPTVAHTLLYLIGCGKRRPPARDVRRKMPLQEAADEPNSASTRREVVAWCLLELAAIDGGSDEPARYSASSLAISAWSMSAKLMGALFTLAPESAILFDGNERVSERDAASVWMKNLLEAAPESKLQAVRKKHRQIEALVTAS